MRRRFGLVQLPANGYTGRAPGLNQYIPKPTARHRAIWTELWRTPQAAAWAKERWRWPVIADLVRYTERLERPDAKVAIGTSIRQLREDLGLSPAGLRANGWEVVDVAPPAPPSSRPPRRLQAVPDPGTGRRSR